METSKSLEIIQNMMHESRKSLARYSFFFLVWGTVLAVAGLVEYFLYDQENRWIVWPVATGIGGIASWIHGYRDGKRAGVSTFGDRIIGYTWAGFAVILFISIVYTTNHGLSPSPMILFLAGFATFITGGICKFNPFVYGGIALVLCGGVCGFILPDEQHGLVYSIGMVLGYIIPGLMLRKTENA